MQVDRVERKGNLDIEVDVHHKSLIGMVDLNLVGAHGEPQGMRALLQISCDLVFVLLVVGAKQSGLTHLILKLEIVEQDRNHTNPGVQRQSRNDQQYQKLH